MSLSQSLIGLLFLSFGLPSIGCDKSGPAFPSRPPNIDKRAAWAGGADGGVWISCEDKTEVMNILRCSIHGESGSHWRTADFVIRRSVYEDGKAIDNEIERRYTAIDIHQIGFSWYDGKRIKLSNEMVLVVDQSLGVSSSH